MKKVLLLVIFAVIALNSYAAKIVVGVSLPTQREERWVRDKKTMEEAAKKLGIDLKMQVSDADAAQQAQQVDNLLSQGIQVLILAPHDAKSAAALADKAKKEGVAVISYDRLITGTKSLDYYISHDNFQVGVLQATYITKLVPKGNYMIFAGAPTDNNAKLFYDGAMSVIDPLIKKGDIKVINGKDRMSRSIDNWLPSNAQSMAENILSKNNNKVDAVIAPNDGTAGGIINALSAQGLKVPISGQDSEVAAIKRIRDGQQTMTIFKNTNDVAKKAIEMAKDIVDKKKIVTNSAVDNGSFNVPSVLLTPSTIDKSNYKKVLVDTGYVKIN
ncbi:MAG: sugar ABC transporter substrate-binding protein [Fusobacteriaceae bacterium]